MQTAVLCRGAQRLSHQLATRQIKKWWAARNHAVVGCKLQNTKADSEGMGLGNDGFRKSHSSGIQVIKFKPDSEEVAWNHTVVESKSLNPNQNQKRWLPGIKQ
jgi:hypothetical protein